jgi:hypothetical protein
MKSRSDHPEHERLTWAAHRIKNYARYSGCAQDRRALVASWEGLIDENIRLQAPSTRKICSCLHARPNAVDCIPIHCYQWGCSGLGVQEGRRAV